MIGIGSRVEMAFGFPFKGTVVDMDEHSYWVRWDDGSSEEGPFGLDDLRLLPVSGDQVAS